MPIFEVQHPDGRTFEVDAPDMGQAASAIQGMASQPSPARPSTPADVLGSFGTGAMKGGIGLAGLPGDIAEYGARGINWATQKIGGLTGLDVGTPRPPQAPTYGSADIGRAVESTLGPAYVPQTTAGRYAETVGEFVPAALGGPGGLARRTMLGAAFPGVGSEAAGQAATGTPYEGAARLGGAVAGAMAPGMAARVITPFPSITPQREQAVGLLRAQGVEPTAGQTTGSEALRYAESALGRLPGAGGKAQAALERSGEQFTGAALRQAGIQGETRATPEVMDRAFRDIGSRFDQLAARNTLRPDSQFGQEMRTAIDDYRNLVSPPNRAPLINNFETEIATALARNGGVLPGAVYQSMTSRLERAARGAAGQPEIAGTLRDLRGALDGAMERSIPANSPDLGAWRQARDQYRNLLAIENAVTSAGPSAAEGLVSPAQLRTVLVGQGRRAYATGQRDIGELARAGVNVLTAMPQSGTAPRMMAYGLPTLVGGTVGGVLGGAPGAISGATIGGAIAPSVAGRILMSPAMQAYLANQQLPFRLPTNAARQAFANALLARQGQAAQPTP